MTTDGNIQIDLDAIEAKARAALVPGEEWHVYSQEGPANCPCGGELESVCTTRVSDAENDDKHRCVAEARGDSMANAYQIAAHIAAVSPAVVLALIERVREAEAANFQTGELLARVHADHIKAQVEADKWRKLYLNASLDKNRGE